MPDRNGNTLTPGEAVMYHHDANTIVGATVLAVNGERYLIQLDQRSPKPDPEGLPPRTISDLDQARAAMAETRALGVDVQEPFEVDGQQLEVGFFDEWDDDEDDDDA